MRPIPYFPNSERVSERGFTLLELLTGLTISAVIFGLITQTLLSQSDLYLGDISRTRIQQNLRGALDILSMNIRQTGEGLDDLFPALLLSQQGVSPTPPTSYLQIRRELIPEVLTICKDLSAGASAVYVSDAATVDAKCLVVNVTPSENKWSTYRTTNGGNAKIYLYNRVTKSGEFLTYSGEGSSGGDNYLTISAPGAAYPKSSTDMYILEEFAFRLDTATKTLELLTNGDINTLQDVAYKIDDFQALILFKDGTNATSLAIGDAHGWKDIQAVRITLSGSETWKAKTFTRSITGQYFPRNVLSH